jgi:hypothetical protein
MHSASRPETDADLAASHLQHGAILEAYPQS